MAANFPSITQTSIIFLFFIQRHKDKKIIECGRVGNNSDRWKKYKRLKQSRNHQELGETVYQKNEHGNQTIIIINSSSGMDVNAYGDEKDGDEAKENDGVNKNG